MLVVSRDIEHTSCCVFCLFSHTWCNSIELRNLRCFLVNYSRDSGSILLMIDHNNHCKSTNEFCPCSNDVNVELVLEENVQIPSSNISLLEARCGKKCLEHNCLSVNPKQQWTVASLETRQLWVTCKMLGIHMTIMPITPNNTTLLDVDGTYTTAT